MEYEEILKLAKTNSDHGDRVQEFEPALVESLANTNEIYPALEIGNKDGGSGVLIMWHLWKENKKRVFISVDLNDAPSLFVEYAEKLGIDWAHYKKPQAEFIKENGVMYGFVYLDAEHDMYKVKEDVIKLTPVLAKGCIVAIDDVEGWEELPEFYNLQRVEYNIDEGKSLGKHGHHIAFYRRL